METEEQEALQTETGLPENEFFEGDVSGNMMPQDDASSASDAVLEGITAQIGELAESLPSGYGTLGDYYDASAGCYAVPSHDVLAGLVGEEEAAAWTCASNGRYVQADSLEAYEEYLSAQVTETEGSETLSETDQTNMESLEGINGTLAAIKYNDAVYHEEALAEMEAITTQAEEIKTLSAYGYSGILIACFFLALLAGAKLADILFSRMRAG